MSRSREPKAISSSTVERSTTRLFSKRDANRYPAIWRWLAGAECQTSRFPPTIGFMGSTTPPVAAQWVASFVQRLRELGWLEGRDVAIEYRWAEGRSERFAEIAAEFVRLKVDIILTARASRVGGTSRPRVVAGAEGSSRIARCRIELYVWLQHARAWDEVCFPTARTQTAHIRENGTDLTTKLALDNEPDQIVREVTRNHEADVVPTAAAAAFMMRTDDGSPTVSGRPRPFVRFADFGWI
jgi:hypothetical protein